jgi:hypothetical protein
MNNRPAEPSSWPGEKLGFRVPAKGIQAFAVGPVETRKTLQGKMFYEKAPRLGPDSIKTIGAPFGKVHGMLMTMGRGLTSAFVYTDALPENVITAQLRWRQGNGEWKILQDDVFPFEFSVWLDEQAGDFEAVMELETTRLEKQESGCMVLRSAGTNTISK